MTKNCLHEKLTALRKHNGYSQGDVARELNIPVNEYMNYENGNLMCGIVLLRKLAEFYHIEVVQLIDNTKTIDLEESDELEMSVQIPFQTINQEIKPLEELSHLSEDTLEEDMADHIPAVQGTLPPAGNDTQANVVESIKQQESNATIEMTQQFEPTVVNQIVEDEQPEVTRENVAPKKKNMAPKKEMNPKLKMGLFIGGACLIVIFLLWYFLDMGKGNQELVPMSSTKKVALGDTFTLYLDDAGSIHSMGDSVPSLSEDKLVAIAAGKDFAVALSENGKVQCSDQEINKVSKDWKDIVDIAAGDRHIVGVKRDGTVECTGNPNGCKVVNEWKDIKKVYAGSDVTIGVDDQQKLYVSGDVSSKEKLEKLSNVSYISIGQDQIAVLDSNGRVNTFAIGTGSTSNTATWASMESVATGNDFVASLAKGNVQVASTDDDFIDDVKELKSIKYIAARNKTLIAISNNGEILGAGDNSHDMYRVIEDMPTPSAAPTSTAAPEGKKLESVTGVKFDVTPANVTVSFNKVKHAEYYTVSINTEPVTTIKSVTPSASIPSDKLETDSTYAVTITAYPKKKDLEASEPVVINYSYNAEKIKLQSPTKPSISMDKDTGDWTISFTGVDNADHYSVACGDVYKADIKETKFVVPHDKLVDQTQYTITITAMPSDGDKKFEASDELTAKATYQKPQVKLIPLKTPEMTKTQSTLNGWTISWQGDPNAANYTVTVGDITVTTTDTSHTFTKADGFDVSSGNTSYTIKFVSNPSDPKTYVSSEFTALNIEYKPAQIDLSQVSNTTIESFKKEAEKYSITVELQTSGDAYTNTIDRVEPNGKVNIGSTVKVWLKEKEQPKPTDVPAEEAQNTAQPAE